MKRIVWVAILLCWSGVAAADIIEWEDADGVRHYTNLKGEVPKEQAGATRVVVDELARQAEGSPTTPAPPAAIESVPERRLAEVVYDRSHVMDAYVRGLERGLDTARTVTGGEGGNVQINGPLAIARTSNPESYYGSYYPPGYYPFVTTSFDRGRSRHLTLRLLLQDQFAIDRAAPFVFEERLGYPVLGPDLNPFLPRGLPHGFPRRTRVIVR